MQISGVRVYAVALATGAVAAQPVLGQVSYASIDDFRSGMYGYVFNRSTPGVERVQAGMDVVGQRRISSFSVPLAPGQVGNTGSAFLNTTGAGTLTLSTTSVVQQQGVFALSYGQPGDAALAQLVNGLSDGGLCGVAIDFNSLNAPAIVDLTLGVWGESGGIAQATFHRNVWPSASAFRLVTTWSQFTPSSAGAFDPTTVDYIRIDFRLPPGATMIVDGVGVVPLPGAWCAMSGAACAAMVRRRRCVEVRTGCDPSIQGCAGCVQKKKISCAHATVCGRAAKSSATPLGPIAEFPPGWSSWSVPVARRAGKHGRNDPRRVSSTTEQHQ